MILLIIVFALMGLLVGMVLSAVGVGIVGAWFLNTPWSDGWHAAWHKPWILLAWTLISGVFFGVSRRH